METAKDPPTVRPLARPRVHARLARAARRPVVAIAAAAGFGKSVALHDFLALEGIDAALYEVARDEGTLLAFVRGLSTAVERFAPSAAAAFPALHERVLSAGDVVHELAEWFDEHLRGASCTIAIDDLHHAAPEAVALLVALVERTRPRLRWIFAARTEIGLPVDAWVAGGIMEPPLGEDDLRFTREEALAAARESGATAGDDDVEALRRLTGGWPIALAIALRTRTGVDDLRSATSGTREMIYRYLAEQIFTALTRAQQRFLLATSVVGSFDLALAAELGASAAFVDDLRRDVTFVREIAPHVYRYHDLFRDFLERELRRSGAAAWFRAHADAAALLERRGDDAGALRLASRVGASEPIVAILRRSGFGLVERGEVETLAGAVDALPAGRCDAEPALLGLRATLDAGRGAFDEAEPRFVGALARAGDAELRALLLHRYGIELVRQGRDATALLEAPARDEALPPRWRAPLLGTLATAYAAAGRLDDAIATAREAIARVDGLDDDLQARVYQQAAYVEQFVPGGGAAARGFATLAVERAVACAHYELAARAVSVLYAVAGEEHDDPAELFGLLERLHEYARKGASRQARVFAAICAFDLHAECGNEAALELLEAELAGEDAALAATASEALLPGRALRAAWRGDFAGAHALLAGSGEQQGSAERRALRHAEIALYAYAAGQRADGNRAHLAAVRALASAPAGRRAVRSQLLLALALRMAGRRADGERHLAAATAAATPAMRRLRTFAAAIAALDASPEQAARTRHALEDESAGLARLLAALRPDR